MPRNHTSAQETKAICSDLKNLKNGSMMKSVESNACRLNQNYHYYYIDYGKI